MKKTLIAVGCFIGAIAGIIIIKMLNLPALVTILLVAGLVVGVIVLLAKTMGGENEEDEATSVEGQSSSGKA